MTHSEDPECLMVALKAGVHAYARKGVVAAELRTIVRHVATGDAYVSPGLAAELLPEFGRPRVPDSMASLTARESKVLELFSHGLTHRGTGGRVRLADKAFQHYRTGILQKLHVRSRTKATLLARQGSASGH